MNTTNLRLISDILWKSSDCEYLDPKLAWHKVGRIERIWRAILSSICTYFDSTRISCLRTSLKSIKICIEENSLKLLPQIRRVFSKYTLTEIALIPKTELETIEEQLDQATELKLSKGYYHLDASIPPQVLLSLLKLFENSMIPLEKIAYYRDSETPTFDKMSCPIMFGHVKTLIDERPFIAIKVVKVDDPKSKEIIFLSQYLSSGLDYWKQGFGENAWYDMSGIPHFFGSSNITAINTGEGPTESQKEPFAAFQKFLEEGEGSDLNRVKWRIDRSDLLSDAAAKDVSRDVAGETDQPVAAVGFDAAPLQVAGGS